MYTETGILEHLRDLAGSGRSLRWIARHEYGGRVTHADVQRALMGQFPKSPDKRAAFGLPPQDVRVNVILLVVLLKYWQPARPKIYKRLRDMPAWMVRWMLENRAEI